MLIWKIASINVLYIVKKYLSSIDRGVGEISLTVNVYSWSKMGAATFFFDLLPLFSFNFLILYNIVKKEQGF